jgi:DNA-binding SARP family transcriptional activator/predicted ATPase
MDENSKKPLTIQANFLGVYEIKVNGCAPASLVTQKNKALLAYLILEHGQEHPRSKVAALFWPDVPEQTALHNLRQALSVIRKAFDSENCGELFISGRDTISFQPDAQFTIDVEEFEAHMRHILERYHHQPGRGLPVTRLRRVLASYQGDLLDALGLTDAGMFLDWLALRREALSRLAVEGSSMLLRYYENRGEWSEARKAAEQLVKLVPWDESAHSRFIDVLLQLAEGSAALAHYQAAERYFMEELAAMPEYQLKQAHEDIRSFFASGRSEPRQRPAMLPLPGYSTPFIGRGEELEKLEDWASDPHCQVITLTGPGGSGKTRLAARLVESQRTLFAGGEFFVSLSGCASLERLCSTVLSAVSTLGERSADPLAELLEWAKNRRALLVLDNVEDCGEAARLAAQLMEASRQMVLVFTAYTRLDLMGERVFALKGLSTRGGAASDAARLFLSHVQAESLPESSSPKFIDNVVHICSLVEGLPLAIDLAAGQVKRISSAELLSGLEANMDILQSAAVNLAERHRSIVASFENCWKHLSGTRQQTLAILTVFQSPFTLQAAEEVCGVNSADVRDLANQSLLTWDAQEHYRFHRSIRQYASEKLALGTDEQGRLNRKHAIFYSNRLLADFANYGGEGIKAFLKNTEATLPDITKGARYWIAAAEWNQILKLVPALFSFHETRSLYREGSLLFEELAGLCATEDAAGGRCRAYLGARTASLRINIQQFECVPQLLEQGLMAAQAEGNLAEECFCLNAQAKLASVKKNSSISQEYAQRALQIARDLGEKNEEAHSLYNIGFTFINLGEISKAEAVLGECHKLCQQLGDWRRLSKALNLLADVACNRGNFDQALQFYGEALKIAVTIGNRYSESLLFNNIGTAYFSQQQYAKAGESYQKSLLVCQEIGDREGEAIALSNLGELSAQTRDFKMGAEYNRQALAISREIGSDWGEVSARVILAVCYRELGDHQAAREEVLLVMEKSLEFEFIYFFNRAVVEACHLLLDRNQTSGLAEIISEITRDEESDEWVRTQAQAVLERLPASSGQWNGKTDRRSIARYLSAALLQ